ncbi:MAG: choice-of-anchor Q domain-containing protein [Bacteroidota bacterium]
MSWEILNCNGGKYASKAIKIKNSSHIIIKDSKFDAYNTIDQSQLPDDIPGSSYSGCTDGIFVTTGSSNITISNCFFKNWGHASFSSNTADPSNRVRNITFHNNELTAPDILYGGRIAYSGYSEDGEYFNNYIHDTIVANQLGGSRNHFHHNIIDTVLYSPLKAGVYANGVRMSNYNIQVRDNIIENNVIANTEGKGIILYSLNFDLPGEVSGNIFRNNIIYNCGTLDNDIAIQFHKDQAGQSIYNNVVENNLIYSSNTTQTSLYQYGGTVSDVATFNTQDPDILDNIGGNPLFVDPANGDYHLQKNSPAIDAGTTPLSTEDYDGNSISNGIAADIGVYEFSPFPWTMFLPAITTGKRQ